MQRLLFSIAPPDLDTDDNQWKLRKSFERNRNQVLDTQFGDCHTRLKLVAAFADGQVKIYELRDMHDLEKWQLQAEFQNIVDVVYKFGNASCLSASISWNPQKDEVQQSSFVLGFSSNMSSLNSPKVWSMTRIIKDGFQLQNFPCQRTSVIRRSMQLLGHLT